MTAFGRQKTWIAAFVIAYLGGLRGEHRQAVQIVYFDLEDRQSLHLLYRIRAEFCCDRVIAQGAGSKDLAEFRKAA